jgi:hypothetical protein
VVTLLVITAGKALLITITFTPRGQDYSITVSDLKQFQATILCFFGAVPLIVVVHYICVFPRIERFLELRDDKRCLDKHIFITKTNFICNRDNSFTVVWICRTIAVARARAGTLEAFPNAGTTTCFESSPFTPTFRFPARTNGLCDLLVRLLNCALWCAVIYFVGPCKYCITYLHQLWSNVGVLVCDIPHSILIKWYPPWSFPGPRR